MQLIRFPDKASRVIETLDSTVVASVTKSLRYAQLLVLERTSHSSQSALATLFSSQAARSGPYIQIFPEKADIYIDLMGHPDKPARCIARGMNSYLTDLADRAGQSFEDFQVVVLDCPEHMLTVMPFRLKKFIESCLSRRQTVVILTSASQKLVDAIECGSMVAETIQIERLRNVESCQY